jgi:hypothetical protein
MSENKGTAHFTITRSDTVGQCMVYFRLLGNASNGADYTADHADSILILNAQTMAIIMLNALSDTLYETDETVVCAIDSVRDDHTIMYSVGTPGTATIVIKNYVEPFTLVPHTVNNPFSFGNSPVPDFILGLPGLNVGQLTSSKGSPQGLILALAPSIRVKGALVLSGKVSIFDVLSNAIVKDIPMAYDSQTKRLYAVWNGRNRNGREVALGTYLAVFEAHDNVQGKTVQKIRIGVQR